MSFSRYLLSLILLLAGLATLAAPMPSNTLYLDVAGRGAPAVAALQAHRTRMQAEMGTLSRFRDELVRRKAISPRKVLPRFDTFIVNGPQGRALPAIPRTRSGVNMLTFAYSGWSTGEQAQLSAFLAQAYPVLVNLYGAPLSSGTLTLIRGGDQDPVQGGELNVTDPANMTLTVEPLPTDFATTDSTQYTYNLLHLVLHAFHAPALIGFDAWEEGMTRAAAAVAMLQVRANFQLIYAFSYLLPLYDELNQPGLATSAFFPSQDIPMMSLWRVGMASSAWMKMYCEKPSLFRDLNAAYAAQVTAGNTNLAGDLGALKGLLAGVVPTVEGTPLYDWYARQYVLQTTPYVGKRMYVYPIPLNDNVSLQIYYFNTNLDGSETPLSGTASLEYLSWDQLPLYPEEGDQVAISSVGAFPGVGFINPSFFNIGDPPTQRIRIAVTIADQHIVTYFPYMTRGTDDNENEFFGALIGANDGTLQIFVPGITLSSINVIQGAFSQQLSTGDISFFAPVQFVYSFTDGHQVTLRRNVGPGFYAPLLTVGDETAVSLTHTFLSGLAMVSLPLTPTESDAAKVFGFTAGDSSFQMARWDPTSTAQDKYRHYPNPNLPSIVPGRGYWVKLSSHLTMTVPGNQLSADDPRNIVLQPGWNMIGNTYNAPLYTWDMTVETSTAIYTLRDAMVQGLVGPVWTYDTSGTYGVKNTLTAWEGGWIVNLTNGPLTLHQRDATRNRSRVSSRLTDVFATGGWALNLLARGSTSQDTMAYLGVNKQAKEGLDGLDWMKPPASGDAVRLAFIHPARRTLGGAYATDFRSDIGLTGESWEFEVTSGKSDRITLSWPDLRSVPSQYRIVLEDEMSNTRQYLRTTAAYTFLATGTAAHPDARRFKITIEPRDTSPLQFLTLQVLPTRGSGLNVQVTMSNSAELMMEVRSVTGKLLRTISVPPTRGSEPIVIGWDGRAMGGKLIPTGAYILNITARTEEGFLIRRSQPVMLRQ